jgi:ATP-binding protein involved in chromosome partitioning
MSDSADLKQHLPAAAQARVQSLRQNEGTVTAVLDGAGLTGSERAALEAEVKAALVAQPGVVEVRVAIMADKPPAPRIIAVGSGKGGVGKSTLAANLAVALVRAGRKVGLVDADIYGPSQPRLLGAEGTRPTAAGEKLIPVATRWGVPLLSMGQLVEPGKAIAWRGPMAGNALGQLIDADWGPIGSGGTEVLVVDLPPGTGDIQLTMLQRYKPAGAVIVSTPQDLALIDAERAMQLFAVGKVPLIGMVENMAGYACPHCGEVSDPFGTGGAEAMAGRLGLDFLGRVPLDPAIRQASDAGTPPAAGEGPQAEAFAAIATRVAAWLDSH